MDANTQRKGEGIYYWGNEEEKHFNEILSLLLKDVVTNSRRRGVFYAGVFDGKNVTFIDEKSDFSDLNTKIYLFFNENKNAFELPGIVSVGAKDKVDNTKFLLYMNEHYSFMCISKDGKYFESSDTLLIDALINKIQIEYYLQWQL